MPAEEQQYSELEERLAESQAEIESLQSSAADAAARAGAAREELAGSRSRVAALEAELAELQSARDTALGELEQLRAELGTARAGLREAAARYRQARLAAAPEVPAELVGEAEDIEAIDRQFEAAQSVVGRVRERMEEEAKEGRRTPRAPAGSPPRREQDLSSLTPGEKIRLGLRELDGGAGR
jgi:chromosome segregation ATPase